MEDSKVYVIVKWYVHEGYDDPEKVCYRDRAMAYSVIDERMKVYNPRNVAFDIFELEVDETKFSEGQRTPVAAVGEGPDPKPVPETGT